MLLQSSYFQLPKEFYQEDRPYKFENSERLVFNHQLAEELGLGHIDDLTLSGQNKDIPSIALAYAGHQFGHFVPQLGDGRAHLLGEVFTSQNQIKEIQLKGSGATPFSRGGDGFSPLAPALREFLISEAMHHLGIPTTRSLAVLKTGEEVYRQQPHPGGIVARVARAHIRVGTFEYFAAREMKEHLLTLINFTKDRLYSDCESAEQVFDHIVTAQANLLAKWVSVGFIHGVMNTDNMSLAGETIDYGPCAFMNTFRWNQVYSSIDRRGRYAFSNQAPIAAWNLSILAGCFLYALGDQKRPQLENSLDQFQARYEAAVAKEFSRKFGLKQGQFTYAQIKRWLDYLEKFNIDFTQAHRSLSLLLDNSPAIFPPDSLKEELTADYRKMINKEEEDGDSLPAKILSLNPLYIPRNHQVDKALEMAEAGDLTLYHQILSAIRSPYEENKDFDFLAAPPKEGEDIPATFCGT